MEYDRGMEAFDSRRMIFYPGKNLLAKIQIGPDLIVQLRPIGYLDFINNFFSGKIEYDVSTTRLGFFWVAFYL